MEVSPLGHSRVRLCTGGVKRNKGTWLTKSAQGDSVRRHRHEDKCAQADGHPHRSQSEHQAAISSNRRKLHTPAESRFTQNTHACKMLRSCTDTQRHTHPHTHMYTHTHTRTHTHTHTSRTAKPEESKKSSWREVLRNCRAVLRVFLSGEDCRFQKVQLDSLFRPHV